MTGEEDCVRANKTASPEVMACEYNVNTLGSEE